MLKYMSEADEKATKLEECMLQEMSEMTRWPESIG